MFIVRSVDATKYYYDDLKHYLTTFLRRDLLVKTERSST